MRLLFAAALSILSCNIAGAEHDSLPKLHSGIAPQTFSSMWNGFDPRAEPLHVETLYSWEEEGVTLRIVRFDIGTFKGQKSRLAGIYGKPKQGTNLPGLVQVHGGGQYADYRACVLNAKRGYATLSIAWAGRIAAPEYTVNKEIVELFWNNKTDDKAYKRTTDWGALDAYHAPCRNPQNAFAHVNPAPWTLDSVDSPRNNPWYLCTLAARRALTFLERQPEVDGKRLGVYGHSMGGKITVMTAAADSRVKAAAPSCGGISDRTNDSELYRSTIGDDVNLRHITCPTIFLSPANDFHGRIDDLQTALKEIETDEWRITCSAHHNHQDNAAFEVASLLWFDEHLKSAFRFPETPDTSLELLTDDGVPRFTVRVDKAKPVLGVEVYYCQQGQPDGLKDEREHTMARFWHFAEPVQTEDSTWVSRLPLHSLDNPLWVYANVLYQLEDKVSGAGYYYRPYTTKSCNLSSRMQTRTPEQLRAAKVRATQEQSNLIESFEGNWQKEWFSYRPEHWPIRTHKIYDKPWRAPTNASLALEVRAEQTNTLVIGIDATAAEVALEGGPNWQHVNLTPADFLDASGQALANWDGVAELRLGDTETLRKRGADPSSRRLGSPWKGKSPSFRRLRWTIDK